MGKNILLKLKSINYTRDSIGNDIHLEIKIQDKIYRLDRSIKQGSLLIINDVIASYEVKDTAFGVDIAIKVIEKDILFNDEGNHKTKITIDPNLKKSQEFNFEVAVQEIQETLRKSKAIFIITLGVYFLDRIPTLADPKWTGDFKDDTEDMILARAIYGEMRGESIDLKIAVGWSIRNRVEDKTNRWGNSYHDIILKKSQYEPFLKASKVFELITNPPISNKLENKAWNESYQVAQDILSNLVSDPTSGANHFYSVVKGRKAPSWSKTHKVILQIRNTKFYKFY